MVDKGGMTDLSSTFRSPAFYTNRPLSDLANTCDPNKELKVHLGESGKKLGELCVRCRKYSDKMPDSTLPGKSQWCCTLMGWDGAFARMVVGSHGLKL